MRCPIPRTLPGSSVEGVWPRLSGRGRGSFADREVCDHRSPITPSATYHRILRKRRPRLQQLPPAFVQSFNDLREAIKRLLAGVDITVIALWLGHESISSTQAYLHADMQQKQEAIEKTAPPGSKQARYKPPDQLLEFLENL